MKKTPLRISVQNLKKTFKIYYDKGFNLKDKILFWKRNRYEIKKVLDGVSFDIYQGEVVGLIGRNGCGKSTLLKLLSGIYSPNGGKVTINGRLSCLIELGAGFHPDMTGRENIYINASIFGLTKKEIDARLNQIIEFSELGNFIDVPVRTYSSGMYMRLAFSVAINVDADILLIDEILAVGDKKFQEKCYRRLEELKQKGVTIIIVTHDDHIIRSFCTRAIWIKDGLISYDGLTKETADKYDDYLEGKEQTIVNAIRDAKGDQLNNDALGKIINIELLDENSHKNKIFSSFSSLKIKLEYQLNSQIKNPLIGIMVLDENNQELFVDSTEINSKKNEVILLLKNLPFKNGEYHINTFLNDDKECLDYHNEHIGFTIKNEKENEGAINIEHIWR